MGEEVTIACGCVRQVGPKVEERPFHQIHSVVIGFVEYLSTS